MKKILIAFVSFFYIFAVPIFASEEDILKEPIKEEDIKEEEYIKEDIEEEPILLKGTVNINNTKSSTNDPLLAKSLSFSLKDSNFNWHTIFGDFDNINIGDKYQIILNSNVEPFSNYYNCLLVQTDNTEYWIRGSEVVTSGSVKAKIKTENGYINASFGLDNSIYNSNDILIIQYVEPTPEPTPTPEPEEPDLDPETISGNEILREILRTNREINENVQGIYKLLSNNSVSDNVLSDNSVSDNIIYKRLEDYSTSESLALIGLVLAFGALVIYLIHKTVFKIRR